MNRNPVVVRISLALVALTCSILIGLDLAGLAPSPADDQLEGRLQLLDALALPTAVAIENNDFITMRTSFDMIHKAGLWFILMTRSLLGDLFRQIEADLTEFLASVTEPVAYL